MALRLELSELLSGFEKRMKFLNIVRGLIDYTYPDNIRKMFPENNKLILDNMILAVLVYMEERTLGSERDCTLLDIEKLLEDFSVVLPDTCKIDCKVLSKFIIVEVLQCGGVLMEYLTFNSA